MLSATVLEGLPEIGPHDDLTVAIVAALARNGHELQAGDVLVVAHKVVSKSEGRLRALREVQPGERARMLAGELGKDPRHVQVVLDESREVLRATRGVLICVTHHGFVCANAGVDASNAAQAETVILLPADPDASARELRRGIEARVGVAPGVVI